MNGFHYDRFPTDISYGSRGGPGFTTNVITVDSGQESRVARRDQERNTYDVSYGIKSFTQLATAAKFYRARKGCANGFPYKDWADFTSNPTDPSYRSAMGTKDQVIGTGNGTTTVFQLKKLYTSGLTTHTRKIRLPVNGTVSIWLDNTLKTEGVDYTIDYTTGEVTFMAAVTAGVVVSASFEFDVPVRFGQEVDELFSISIDEFDSGSIDSIPLVELIDPDPGYAGELFSGGALERVVSASYTMSTATARTYNLSSSIANCPVLCPDPAAIGPGGPIFFLRNGGGSNNLVLKDNSGTTLVTLTPGNGVEVLLTVDGAGNKIWEAQ